MLIIIAFVRKHYTPEGDQNNCPAKYPTLRKKPSMFQILECRKLEGSKLNSPLNVASRLHFLIDQPEVLYTTSFWSSETKYGIKNFIALQDFFWRIF